MAAAERRLRIFLGIPCYGPVGPEILEDYMRLMFHMGRRLPQYDLMLGVRSKAEQFRARNQIAESALQTDCDYLLMLDDDMIVNVAQTTGTSDAYGFIERLIAHGKDVIGALYYQKTGECAPVLMMRQGESGYRFLRDDEITHDLQRVDVAGGGCLLVTRKVLSRLPYPWFGPEFEWGTDVQLCRAAAERGFEVWADTSIELGHLKPEQSIVSSRTRHRHQGESVPGEVRRTFVGPEVYEALRQDAEAYTGYQDLDAMAHVAFDFLAEHDAFVATGASDHDWYRQHPKERIARQVWFNSTPQKRSLTEFILNSVNHTEPKDILDFGCGIGLPAFVFAQKGHRVTACDLAGTGTLEFLKWRVKTHGVDLVVHESTGDRPHLGSARFDVIVAMDCLEHIVGWQDVLRDLAARLKPNGVLFANNAILDDQRHPEHYPLGNRDFVAACLALDLMPVNEITYTKRVKVATPTGQDERRLAHA